MFVRVQKGGFYGRNTLTLEFWSQCRTSNFGTISIVCPVVNGKPSEPPIEATGGNGGQARGDQMKYKK